MTHALLGNIRLRKIKFLITIYKPKSIIMRKLFYLLVVVGFISFTTAAKAQLIDEKNVTVVMDLQPVLQLNMTTPDHIDFVFDEIREYYAGITKYGATILKVSASVSWDLYAVGVSQTGAATWDVQMEYNSTGGGNASNAIPLSALELHQTSANAYDATALGNYTDYSTVFGIYDYTAAAIIGAVGQNSIYYDATTWNGYTAPSINDKYLQGQTGTAVGEGALGGSYLATDGTSLTSDYYFIIDYRILPGLPAVFPYAGSSGVATPVTEAFVSPVYAAPGVYSMDVKYVLLEDQ